MTFIFEAFATVVILHFAACAFFTKEVIEFPFYTKLQRISNILILWLIPLVGPALIWQKLQMGPAGKDGGKSKLHGSENYVDE